MKMDLEILTKEEKKLLSQFMEEIIKNNDTCQSCGLCYGNCCYFASECLTNNFCHFTETGV